MAKKQFFLKKERVGVWFQPVPPSSKKSVEGMGKPEPVPPSSLSDEEIAINGLQIFELEESKTLDC